MLDMAPHLAWPLRLITPVKSWFGLPYYRMGMGMYDMLSGSERLGKSRFEKKAAMKQACPHLDLTPLKGGVSYLDGQFDDARFGVGMVRHAIEQGGHAVNYTKVNQLLMTNGKVTGAECHDLLDGETLTIHARAVVNCTGPWTDELRYMANPDATPAMQASSGIHIAIDEDLVPEGHGILVPETDDGRVLFILPWLGKTIIGTTDDPAALTDTPEATEAEIGYLIREVNKWLDKALTVEQVTATFSGLRPLVKDPNEDSTSSLSRDHVILTEKGLVTLTGGKWTTWRNMATPNRASSN